MWTSRWVLLVITILLGACEPAHKTPPTPIETAVDSSVMSEVDAVEAAREGDRLVGETSPWTAHLIPRFRNADEESVMAWMVTFKHLQVPVDMPIPTDYEGPFYCWHARTVYVDAMTGQWLQSSSVGASPPCLKQPQTI
jgi:hypothetical protein